MDRRKAKNILLQPRLQFRYAFKVFVFAALAIGAVQVVSYALIRAVVARVLAEAGPQAAVLTPVVDLAVRTELLRVAWILPAVALGALVLTSRVLHRFIGPAVAVRRTLERLARGDYGAECRTRRHDNLQDVVAAVNGLSQALAAKEQARRRKHERLREAGFSLIELLVVLTVLMVIGMIVVAQFLTAYDRSRQRGTLADLRTIATANGSFSVDAGDYADALPDLTPYYLGTLPPVDRWGYAWQYTRGARSYELTSRGSDGAVGPAAPSGWDGDPYECDLVVENGTFVQAPVTS